VHVEVVDLLTAFAAGVVRVVVGDESAQHPARVLDVLAGDDVEVALAAQSAGDGQVSLLGGSISRQCLQLGLVVELHIDVAVGVAAG